MIYNEDCLEGMKKIADKSVDAIIADLPYNTTACTWDKSVINLDALWIQFKRIIKPCSAIVPFAGGKFTHKLIASNFDQYKYKWIWVKNTPTMFVHAKNAPMHRYEEICVFSDGVINHATVSKRRMKYNPQGLVSCEELRAIDCSDKPTQLRAGGRGAKWTKSGANATHTQIHNPHPENFYVQEQTGYPSDILNFDAEPNARRLHPTQKPVPLLEYLIKTYMNEGETVLDATMGSGSTGVACVNTNRKFIGFELDEKYFKTAERRIAEALAKKRQELF